MRYLETLWSQKLELKKARFTWLSQRWDAEVIKMAGQCAERKDKNKKLARLWKKLLVIPQDIKRTILMQYLNFTYDKFDYNYYQWRKNCLQRLGKLTTFYNSIGFDDTTINTNFILEKKIKTRAYYVYLFANAEPGIIGGNYDAKTVVKIHNKLNKNASVTSTQLPVKKRKFQKVDLNKLKSDQPSIKEILKFRNNILDL